MGDFSHAVRYRYFLYGWPLPALVILSPLAITVFYAAPVFEEINAESLRYLVLSLIPIAVLSFTYTKRPICLLLAETKVGVKFLFGPTRWYYRDHIAFVLRKHRFILELHIRDTQFPEVLTNTYYFYFWLFVKRKALLAAIEPREA